ncbi:MAG: hypothetical protein HUK06_10155 [Bacteroidaceae bacterium]|nr:hypothetical protein [Bacteroidaceae bacterium]
MIPNIVISDTNIFIDLVDAGVIDAFFALPFEIHTTTYILEEILKIEQRDAIKKYIDDGHLHVTSLEGEKFLDLLVLYNGAGSNLSVNDCSVWLLASIMGGALLTGDANLRRKATQNGVEVHGVLYVIDKMVEHAVISTNVAHAALEFISQHNRRLPICEIEKRLELWK